MTETGMAPSQPQSLDDVMIAMDVVDTLRHREDLVRRELNEEGREGELIARLRQIYRDQGIEVPDQVLAEGVKALKDSRFVYTPPPASWKRTLLTLWVKRQMHSKRLGIAAAALVALFGSYHLFVTRPAKLAQERARIEISETLPKQLRQAHADVMAIATDEAAKQKADSTAERWRKSNLLRRSRRHDEDQHRSRRAARGGNAPIHAYHCVAPR